MNAPPTIPDLFLIQNGEVTGPHPWAEVEQLWDTRSINDATECCEEGGSDWLSLRDFVDQWKAQQAEPLELTIVQSDASLVATGTLSSKRWFVVMSGVIVGPYGMTDMRSLVSQRLITAETMVCLDGDSQWHPLALAIPKLKARRAVNRTVLHHTGLPTRSTKPRSGCLHVTGGVLLIVGALCCFTIVGIPLGLTLMLVGGVIMIAAK